jgi:hypothetical protein
MTDVDEMVGQRDRSPAFPVVPLETALERLAEFEEHYKRSPARPEKVGEAWSIKNKAYADRIAAALQYFGLLEYQGSGRDRSIVISDEGRKYLRAHQEETKQEVRKTAALRPKKIADFWSVWGSDRPADTACLDDLIHHGFSDGGAQDFLKVYDSTIAYAKLSDSDKAPPALQENQEEATDDTPPPSPPVQGKVKLMEGERIVFTEESAPQRYIKLVASGNLDESLLDAIEDYVKRQKKRLQREARNDKAAN